MRAVGRYWPVLRWVLALAFLAGFAYVLDGQQGELVNFGDALVSHWWWLLPAAALEAISLGCFAGVQYRLLAIGGVRAPIRPLLAITLGSQAITNSVPGGPLVAAVYGFRWYRRFGADEAVALWALIGTSIAAFLSLALLATIGVALATGLGANLDLIPVVIGVFIVTLLIGALFVYPTPVGAAARLMLRASRRLIGRPRGDLEARIDHLVTQVTLVRLDWRNILRVLGWALANWLADCGCFAVSFLAVGAGVPWKGLLLAYGAGQLAANLPITPGGLGVVEGSITLALTYFGGAQNSSLEAVLVYRLFSFWAQLIVGWSGWGAMALAVRRGRWPRSVLAPQLALAAGQGGPELAGPSEGEPSTVSGR